MMKKNDLRHWIVGIISAIISGAATSVTAVIVAPESFNLHDGKERIATVMLVGAVFSLGNYLKQKPLPECADGDPECEKQNG